MDEVFAKWFDDSTVIVRRSPELDGFMTDDQIARIVGAPRDSSIVVSADDGAIAFKVDNKIFSEPMFRYLLQNPDGSYSFHLRNVVLVLKERYTNEGIGPRCVIREIHEAASWTVAGIPITHIQVSAVGDFASFVQAQYPLRGYYVWAAMGFDGDIPAASRAAMDSSFRNCSRIGELVSTDEGCEQWLVHGQSAELSFDLAPDSTSWRQLARYMSSKGILP